mgnify:CR=1 FL=1
MERIKIQLLTAKIESTYGTDSGPTATNNTIDVLGNTVQFQVLSEKVDRIITDRGYGRLAPFITKKHAQIRFRVELRGNRTDGTSPDISRGSSAHAIQIDPLLRACDLAATYTAESSSGARDGYVTYKPTVPTGVGSSCTIYWYTETKVHKLKGCKGTFEIFIEAGKPAYIDFTFTGILTGILDTTFSSLTPTHLHTKPPLVSMAVSTYNSLSAIWNRLNLNLGNTISRRDSVLSAEGIAGFMITDRAPSGSIDPECNTEATEAWWTTWAAETAAEVIARFGYETGNRFDLNMYVVAHDVNYGERNGARIHQIQFDVVQQLMTSTPGNELAMKFS